MKYSLFFLLFAGFTGAAQKFTNNAFIVTEAGTTITIKGAVKNNSGGAFKVHGTMRISGDIENHDGGYGFTGSTGKVVLDGVNQAIGGPKGLRMPVLELWGGTKTMTQWVSVGYNISGTSPKLLLNNAVLKLNKQTLTIRSATALAIQRTTGFIESETSSSQGLGRIKLEIGGAPQGASYAFPFGNTATGNYLPLTITLHQAAPSGGVILAATYATDAALQPNNRPLPPTVTHFNTAANQEMAPKALDRFWIIISEGMPADAKVNISGTYRNSEWDASSNSKNTISETSLKPIYWNATAWASATGAVNTSTNLLSFSNVLLSKGILTAYTNAAAAAITSSTTSIEMQKAMNTVMVGPNPTEGRVRITMRSAQEEQITILLTDGKGSVLLNKSFQATQGLNVQDIDLSGKPAGVYLLQLIGVNTIKETHRIVKN